MANRNRIKTNKNAFSNAQSVQSDVQEKTTQTEMKEKSVDEKTERNRRKKKKQKHHMDIKNVRKDRKVLVVIDVQNDFIVGVLGNPECVVAEQRIVQRLKDEADKFDAFYFTRDTHYQNYLETLEGQKLPVEHCIAGTSGWDFTDGIKEAMKVLREKGKYVKVINKHTFGSSSLADILSVTCGGNDEIELMGVCTDICVVSNALSLRQMMPNRVIKVNPSFCAGTSRAAHKAALRTMNSCQIEIVAGGNY